MKGFRQYRERDRTVCFWMNWDERRELEERIAVSGMRKGDYFRQTLLNQQITITGGKFHSDRLSVEIRRLREALEHIDTSDDLKPLLEDCKALAGQFISIVSKEEP